MIVQRSLPKRDRTRAKRSPPDQLTYIIGAALILITRAKNQPVKGGEKIAEEVLIR